MTPLYEHDCEVCRFLGHDSPHLGEPRCNGVDLYICMQGRLAEGYALIRRYGSEPSNYGCLTVGSHSQRYETNMILAQARGLI